MELTNAVMLILAEGQFVDPIGNASGWTGAGLLGLVLGWLLLKHLPAKDSQIASLISDKDIQIGRILADKDRQLGEKDKQLDANLQHKFASIQQMLTDHAATIKFLTIEFRGTINDVSAHWQKTEERLLNALFDREQADPSCKFPIVKHEDVP